MFHDDPILREFLRLHTRHAVALAAANPGLLEIAPLEPGRILVRYHCRGFCRGTGTMVGQRDSFDVGLTIDADYLRRVDRGVVTMLTPDVFHPNIIGPLVCLGHLAPATGLADILVQVYEMLTWKTLTPHDCLNPEAAQWARNHPTMYPLERDRCIRVPRLHPNPVLRPTP